MVLLYRKCAHVRAMARTQDPRSPEDQRKTAMLRYAVLGAQGQLGRELCQLWGAAARPLTRAEADLANPDAMLTTLKSLRPEFVVNCAAYNFVDRAETERDAAFAVNAVGVHHLARFCAENGATLVHFSTDYVFGRETDRTTPYTEDSSPGPMSVYAASKLAGEYLARSTPKHFVIRTCGLYGPAGRTSQKGNFIEMILRQLSQEKPLRVVADQRCTPTSCIDLAAAIDPLLATEEYGLYHLTNAGDCSWHEFATAILEILRIDRPIAAVGSDEFNSAAKRPGYSVLSCEKSLSLTKRPMRHWREPLAAYLAQRTAN
jgi:dTDP-4-dehydrorhamnose reductase